MRRAKARADPVRAFNGPFWGTWHAALNPTDRAALPVPECTPTAVTNPLPDLRIELVMQCSVEP